MPWIKRIKTKQKKQRRNKGLEQKQMLKIKHKLQLHEGLCDVYPWLIKHQ